MNQVGTGNTDYTYDSAGRLSAVSDPFGGNVQYSYDSAGRLDKRVLANGTYEAFIYDSQSRVTEIRTMKTVVPEGPDTLIKSRAYTFDLASQVTSVVEGGITTNYAYDLAGQLTSEVKSSGYSASYSYDANGNRLSRTVNGVTENYSYDAGDKLLSVTGGVDPRNFVYDAAGRTTSIQRASGNTNFTYDYESRVTSITKPGMVTNSMAYNGLGTRVGLTDSGGSKQYVRDGVGVTSPVLSDGNSTFTAGGERTNGVSKTLHSGLKNDDLQTNASGSVIGERFYDAFGNVVSNSGAWSSHSGYGGKFGYQDDADSSLKLLGHRYYDSSTGRFLVRDRIKEGRNWYVYCESAPIKRVDPNGLDSFGIGGSFGGFAGIVGLDIRGGLYFDPQTGNVGFGRRYGIGFGVGAGLGGNGFVSYDSSGVPPPGETSTSNDVGLHASGCAGLGGSGFYGGRLDGTPGSEWNPSYEVSMTFGPDAELSISNQYGWNKRWGLFNLYEVLDVLAAELQEVYKRIREAAEAIVNGAKEDLSRIGRNILNPGAAIGARWN